jgi:hypothetical protein
MGPESSISILSLCQFVDGCLCLPLSTANLYSSQEPSGLLLFPSLVNPCSTQTAHMLQRSVAPRGTFDLNFGDPSCFTSLLSSFSFYPTPISRCQVRVYGSTFIMQSSLLILVHVLFHLSSSLLQTLFSSCGQLKLWHLMDHPAPHRRPDLLKVGDVSHAFYAHFFRK